MSEPADVRTVSRFEANLLRIARFILRQAPVEQAQRLILDKIDRPKCLSGDCLHLLKDSLRKGVVLWLVKAGAWRRDRFLRDGQGRFGRLWERTEAEKLALSFGKPTVELLMWLTATRAKDDRRNQYQAPARRPARHRRPVLRISDVRSVETVRR